MWFISLHVVWWLTLPELLPAKVGNIISVGSNCYAAGCNTGNSDILGGTLLGGKPDGAVGTGDGCVEHHEAHLTTLRAERRARARIAVSAAGMSCRDSPEASGDPTPAVADVPLQVGTVGRSNETFAIEAVRLGSVAVDTQPASHSDVLK